MTRAKPTPRVKAWLDEHAVIERRDGRDWITYPARDDLIPPDVKRWIDALFGKPLKRT